MPWLWHFGGAMPRPRLSAQQQALRRGGKPRADRGPLYEIHPGPQLAFMMTDAEEVLYGGAAGGGKSVALRAWGVSYCLEHPGALGILFRRTYRELEDTHILALQQEVPSSLATYSSGSHNMIFSNGSMIMCRFCDHEEDVRGYDTAEFDFMLFDELTHFTQFMYTYLLSRCRSTKAWWPGRRIRSAATPLGVGHAWVKARFVDSNPPNQIWKAPVDEGSYTRQFIPAKVTDNLTLMKMNPQYIQTLEGLPPDEKRAKLYGDWNIPLGQFFQRWRPAIHVVSAFDIPPDWNKWIGVDYGFDDPYAALWVARPPGTNTVWFYREHYGSGVLLKEQVSRAWQATDDAAEKLNGVVLDPAMFGKVNVKGEQIRPMSEDWRDLFGGIATIYRGNNERVSGWRLMRQVLDWKEGPNGAVLIPPQVFVMDTCPDLARTIPLLITDKHNVEDVDTTCEDHLGDTVRYLLRHIFEGSGRANQARRYYMGPQGIAVGRPSVYNPRRTPGGVSDLAGLLGRA